MKIKNDEGQEIEVFTPEEVQARLDSEVSAKLEEAKQGWESESNQKLTEVESKLTGLEQEKADLETKLAGLSTEDKDHPNFKALKESLDKKDKSIKELADSVSSLRNQREADFLDNEIKKVIGKDDELGKTLKHHYKETLKSMPSETQEQIRERLEAAKKLTGVTESVNPLDMAGAGGGYFNQNPGGGAVELTSNERALAPKLGISEEDIKKYSPKLK